MTGIRSASSAYVDYAYETTFQGAGATKILFGKEQKASGLEFINNQMPLGQLYTSQITDFLYNRNQGSVTMDYIMSNPWWLTAILNNYTVTGPIGGVYSFVWDSDPSVNSNIRTPKTMTLNIGEAFSPAIVRQALGAVTPTLTIRSAIDNPISISQAINWGLEPTPTTSLDNSLPVDTFTPYNFVNGTLELPSGVTIADLQDFDITFDTGASLIWGHASPDATDRYNKILNMTGRVQIALKDATLLQDVINRSELATLRIFISNGLSGADLKSIELLFTGVGISSHRTIGLAPGELLLEEISFQCRNILATAKNSISPPPY